jgi:hypothetical protein
LQYKIVPVVGLSSIPDLNSFQLMLRDMADI